jgi:hypothetical protein
MGESAQFKFTYSWPSVPFVNGSSGRQAGRAYIVVVVLLL